MAATGWLAPHRCLLVSSLPPPLHNPSVLLSLQPSGFPSPRFGRACWRRWSATTCAWSAARRAAARRRRRVPHGWDVRLAALVCVTFVACVPQLQHAHPSICVPSRLPTGPSIHLGGGDCGRRRRYLLHRLHAAPTHCSHLGGRARGGGARRGWPRRARVQGRWGRYRRGLAAGIRRDGNPAALVPVCTTANRPAPRSPTNRWGITCAWTLPRPATPACSSAPPASCCAAWAPTQRWLEPATCW